MAGLSRKDQLALLNDLEAQGAEIVPRKDGWTVRFDTGDTLNVHKSQSDTKSFDAMRAIVKRAGLNWLFDGRDTKAMNAQKKRKQGENRELVEMYLEEHRFNTVNPQRIVQDLGITTDAVYRALHALDWVKYKYGEWGPLQELPTPASVEAPEPTPSLLDRLRTPIGDTGPAAGGHKQPWEEKAPEPEWTQVKLTKGIAELTLNELLNAYRAAGFKLELRIRKDGVVE